MERKHSTQLDFALSDAKNDFDNRVSDLKG